MIEDFIRQWSDQSEWIWAHTSGSTGKPKDIRLAKADMIVSAKATTDFFNIGRQSFMVCPLSVDYIAGKMMWVRGKVSEAEVVFEQPSMMPLATDYNRIIDLVPYSLPRAHIPLPRHGWNVMIYSIRYSSVCRKVCFRFVPERIFPHPR